jgi:septal ring factor EnvC (AmiA/AmiB activator)
MNPENNQNLALEIELIKRDISQFEKVITKLDQTNDKLQDLINNISKIVSLHEQKFSMTEKSHDDTTKVIADLTSRVEKVERVSWVIVGIATFITVVINAVSSYFPRK